MASLEEGRAALDNDDNNSQSSLPSSTSSLAIEDLQRDHNNTSSSERSSSLARQASSKTQVVRRISTAQSLDTGKSGEVVTMKVQVLEDSSREPMDSKQRRKKEFKQLFKAAAETVIAENKVQQSSNENSNENNEGGSDLFRNLANSVVTRRRLFRLSQGEENQPQHYHGRLMVQASRVRGGNMSDQDESSSSSSSSNTNSSADAHQATNQDAAESTGRRRRKKKKDKSPHYRLALHKGPKGNIVVQTLRAFGISAGSTGIYDSTSEGGGCRCFGVSPNELVTGYLRWSFRTSFKTYFLSAALSFFGLTIVFALLCWWSGKNHPHCIYVNGVEFGTQSNWGNFLDAYSLSWTTFSTVGYGLIFPSTSVIEGSHRDCYGIYILTTLEAYVGILFASLTGAIVFSKITRVRSQAQVMFSDPIVVKYGSGVFGEEDGLSSTGQSGNAGGGNKDGLLHNDNYPFPVLEFRVVNRLNSVIKGEIMDCVMSVVASIDEHNACRHVQKAAAHIRRRKGKKRGSRERRASTKSLGSPSTHPTIKESRAMSFGDYCHRSDSMGSGGNDSSSAVLETNVTRRRKHTAFDEETDGKLCPRRIFSKLEIDGGPDHPFFKRVWIARHTIDLHSPLLTNEARHRIRLNGGRWPKELASHEAVRKSISFDQILVSFSGTSNADANSVYAQKVYEYGDMNVGYTFVSMLYRDLRDGSIKCDLTLLNNVYEQYGGGGEPLQGVEDERDFADHLSGIMAL